MNEVRINPLRKKPPIAINPVAYVRINKNYTANVFSLDSLINYVYRRSNYIDIELFALVKESPNPMLNLDISEYIKEWKNSNNHLFF